MTLSDLIQAGKSFLYVTSHPDQLSLAIPPWKGPVGAISTGKIWGESRCISLVSVSSSVS